MSEIEKEIVDSAEVKESKNFIEQIIEKDLAEGVYDTVHTRFPPEPNGYLQETTWTSSTSMCGAT